MRDLLMEKYPDLVINNEYFLDEKNLKQKPNALSLDEIALLCSLSDKEAKIASKFIFYVDGRYTVFNDMVKYIAINGSGYLDKVNETTLNNREKVVYNIYQSLFLKKTYTKSDLINIHNKNMHNIDLDIKRVDINFYNEILIFRMLYEKKLLSKDELSLFKSTYYEIIRRRIIEEYSKSDESRLLNLDKYVNEVIDGLLTGKINIYDLFLSFSGHNRTLLKLLSKYKIGFMLNSDIPAEIFDTIKGGTIKNIFNELKRKKVSLMDDELYIITIKMICYLGADNSSKIVRNLPKDDYDTVNFLELFKNLSMNGIKIINGKLDYNSGFIKFFIGSNIKEPNSLFNKIKNKDTNLGSFIDYIYEYWDELDNRYSSQQLQTRMAFLESAFNHSRVFLNPDEFMIEDDVINSYLDNKTFQKLPEDLMIKEIRDVYKSMRHNYEKSIPYVSGEYNGILYECLKADDPTLLKIGNITGCCFKLGGDSDDFVRYCANDKNARVIVFKHASGKILAMVPIVRNGNMLICNSVESTMTVWDDLLRALKDASDKIISISSMTEDDSQRIKGALLCKRQDDYDSYDILKRFKSKRTPLPIDKNIYVNMGPDYDYYVVSKDYNKDEELLEFDPSIVYIDPRDEVIDLENESIDDSIKKVLNSMYFEKYGKVLSDEILNKIRYLSYNKDWFSLVTNDYEFIHVCVGKDKRAILEYQEAVDAYFQFSNVNIKNK